MTQTAETSGSEPPPLAPKLERNVAALRARRDDQAAQLRTSHRIAEIIGGFAGSMRFVVVHLIIVAGWVAVNLSLIPGVPAFDRSFDMLSTCASVEAIFLSTFVLIIQNRAAIDADRRADLDLQINLLTEHEVTRLIALVQAVARRLDVDEAQDPELDELRQDVAPEAVLDHLEKEHGRI